MTASIKCPTKRQALLLLTGIFLFCLLSIYREHLIPYNVAAERRSALLTGDEPTYLLMSQAIARGHGMNVQPVNEDESWRAFQNRPVLSPDQWTWKHYYSSWLTPVIDRSREWGNAQKPPFTPLLPALLAPITSITGHIRWWSALLHGILLCVVSLAIIRHTFPESNGRVALILLTIIAGCSSIPIGYYTAQVFPEILAAACIIGFLILSSSQSQWKASAGSLLLCASIWATPRVAPAFIVSAGFISWNLITRRHWLPALLALLGAAGFLLFNLYVWSSWMPPMGSSFLKHFLGDVLSFEFIHRIFLGVSRFFLANDVGLFFFSPLMFAGIVALTLNLFLLRTREDLLVAFLVGVSIVSVALYDDYRAGTCPAGRYQVIAACLLIYSLAVAIRRLPDPILQRMVPAIIILALASLTIGILTAYKPHYWYRRYHPIFGYPQIQSYYYILPSFRDGIPALHMLYWIVIFSSSFLVYDLYRRLLLVAIWVRTRSRKPTANELPEQHP